jgi:transcriptional regulator with XRE-family HTH domain
MTLAPSELHSKLLALVQRLQERAVEDPSWTESVEALEHLLALVVAEPATKSLSRAQIVAFGKLLRDKRNAAGLSRTGLARKAKLSESTLKFLETARHPPSRATLSRLVGVAELNLRWAEVPGQGPAPSPTNPAAEEPPPRALELNWFVAPGYDPIRMVSDLGRFLSGAGGHVEQTQVYLDPQSSAAYLAVCRHPAAAILRASVPLVAAAKHIAAACESSSLRVIALGAGEATLETQLVQHLLESAAAPRLDLCLLDISQPLLAAGFQHATEALGGRSGVSVWGMQADFHHLGEYPPLRRAPKQRQLFCLLGGTLANLDHEPRFFRHSLRGEPGDLLLVDLQLARSSLTNPEDIKKRERTWSGGASQLLTAWLGGPIWRHCKDVTNVEFRWELDAQSPIPGSYALEAIATVQATGRDAREFSMYRFRRYDPSGLTECLRELGWHELAALPYGPTDQPSSLRLFVAHS